MGTSVSPCLGEERSSLLLEGVRRVVGGGGERSGLVVSGLVADGGLQPGSYTRPLFGST